MAEPVDPTWLEQLAKQHYKRQVQVGSKTHGGGPEYALRCICGQHECFVPDLLLALGMQDWRGTEALRTANHRLDEVRRFREWLRFNVFAKYGEIDRRLGQALIDRPGYLPPQRTHAVPVSGAGAKD